MTVPAVGEWSVKDILAHLASWEEQILPDLRRVREGRQPALAAFNEADVDQWNALLVGLRRAFPLSQVRQKLAHYRSAIIEALDSLPHFAICAGHDRRHAEHIRHWRQQEGV